MSRIREGKVVRVLPQRVVVDVGGERLDAFVRGQLKSGPRRRKHVVAVGDRVRVLLQGNRGAAIEEVLPRRNRISRVDPAYPGGTMEQVLAANLDWLVVAVSYAEPPVNRRVLDRLLVLGETAGIPAIVVFNKTDLAAGGTADPFPLYEGIGYRGLRTSAKTGAGCGELRRLVEGRQSLLLGPSGVGKTSLLNAMLPGAGLRTRPVSRATGKGVHTTTRVDLHPLPGGGAILDSPGLRSVQPWGLEETELARCFPELASLPSCQFRDCRHRQEPGCQVRIAVGDGSVDRERYESYLRILETLATRDSWRLSGDSG